MQYKITVYVLSLSQSGKEFHSQQKVHFTSMREKHASMCLVGNNAYTVSALHDKSMAKAKISKCFGVKFVIENSTVLSYFWYNKVQNNSKIRYQAVAI